MVTHDVLVIIIVIYWISIPDPCVRDRLRAPLDRRLLVSLARSYLRFIFACNAVYVRVPLYQPGIGLLGRLSL